MPRQVDPEQRRLDLADAVWRVIRRDGIAGASVRKVAREAGLSAGSLRHYFTTQPELLGYALRLVGDHVRERLLAIDLDGGARQVVDQVAQALVPLDDQRRAEAEVWLLFAGATLTDAKLRALNEQAFDNTRRLLRDVLADLAAAGLTRDGFDADLEAARLHAILDGLAMHGVLRPSTTTLDRIRAVLALHLGGLCR